MPEPIRYVIPLVLLTSVVGAAAALWWERYKPSSYVRGAARRPEAKSSSRYWREQLADWRSMSTAEQEAYDIVAIEAAAAAADAEDAARLAVERATDINATFRP